MPRLALEGHGVQCPYCWEEIELDLDLSAGSQTYTEDCQVCCQPILVRLNVDEEQGRFSVEVEAENG
jgi:hypothetical protein